MSIPHFFDVHTHTHFAAFADDTDAVIKRALAADTWMINVGTQADTSAGAVETARCYPEGVYATVGLHPVHTGASYHDAEELGDTAKAKGFTSRGEVFDYDYYLKLGQDIKVVAVGECGLDYYRLGEDTKPIQQIAFENQIALARELQKPLMIHCRNAFEDLIRILSANRSILNAIPGIVHFFSGTEKDARNLLDLGFSFSFGGVITFARDYDGVVRFIPMDRIVLETDAPYITPVPYRGTRNEPMYVAEAAKKLAEIKELPFDEAARLTTENARRIFGA